MSTAKPLLPDTETKNISKRLRLGKLSADEIDEVYRRALATPEHYYYRDQRTKDWRKVMDVLTGDAKGAGSPLYASVLGRLIRHLLKTRTTVQRGLNLLAIVAEVTVIAEQEVVAW